MKARLLFAVIVVGMLSLGAAGQVTTLKNDIPESQYVAAVTKAMELLAKANYRSVWTKEYFEDRSKPGKLNEKKLREVIQPNKWRTVEEMFYDKTSREEIIADGKAFYFRTNDGPWLKGGLGNGSGGGSYESGQVKNQYRFVPSVDFDGTKADFYELVSIRTANKLSQTGRVNIKYLRTSRSWYSAEGSFLKKIEETMIEGGEEMLRETTIYEYNPKNFKIEAPIKEAPVK